jgi:glucose-6-phosphate isomerase
MKSNLRFDISHMMADYTGIMRGISPEAINALVPRLISAHAALEERRGKDMQGWMDLPYNQAAVLYRIEATAKRIRKDFKAFVVLGIGGSALGPCAVHLALNHPRYNELPRKRRGGPRFYVEDNIDPERMASLLDVIDLKKTCFNVVTKSGGTAETMSQYLIIKDALKRKLGSSYRDHIIATTSADRGSLAAISKAEGYETFFIPDGVGGRFSELSPAGLLPAAVCGIDICELLEGAKTRDAQLKANDVWHNPALMEAALMYIATRDLNVNISVMMPYADSLRLISDWYAQLWAESLGKNVTRKGDPINAGQTPVKALGVTDQHSQLQLYTEGPYDKVVTFIKVDSFRSKMPIPRGCPDIPEVSFLGGKSHNELIEAERRATEYALFKSGRMSKTIILPSVTPHSIGQLIYFYEMATAYMGELMDIDAFNQPGVEESKTATFAQLGHTAAKYAEKRAEMDARPVPPPKYIL